MRISKFIIIITILALSCSKYEELNQQIFDEQKSHIENSRYKDAGRGYDHIKAQLDFRKNKLPELLNINLSELKRMDTVYLMEDYNHICFNCPSDLMQILVNNQIVEIKTYNSILEIDTVNINLDSVKYQLQFPELLEIRRTDISGQDWSNNSLQLGADGCFDGNHTFVTAIYPNGQIKTVYARCWIPDFQRN
ncbi:hypothetical protein [Marinoscillum sp. MHG1-6]|uniref:hypothetical protein n=1 Tax=Marinoscillum sp. MHG1-6 TaxID=2959627 RepID=UPI00215896DA|nr:hypothetical protein [Marinoscillum sp. MHG1-6]